MKDSNASNARDFSRSVYSTVSFKTLTAGDLNSLLLSFYLGLDFDARRARFGCGMSDDAISQHCLQLDPNRTIVLACFCPAGLLAAIELHPLSSGWDESSGWENLELAIAERATIDRRTIIAHLLQLAAFAAGKRGCNTFIIPCWSSERGLIELLRSMGRVRVQENTVRVELGEYARLRVVSDSRF